MGRTAVGGSSSLGERCSRSTVLMEDQRRADFRRISQLVNKSNVSNYAATAISRSNGIFEDPA